MVQDKKVQISGHLLKCGANGVRPSLLTDSKATSQKQLDSPIKSENDELCLEPGKKIYQVIFIPSILTQ
jgi:hypothetical protein